MRRPVVAVVLSAALAALGAVVLGEYALGGATALVAGALFGVAVAETAASVERVPDRYLEGAVALLAEAGLVWATWISTAHRPSEASPSAWVGVALGAVVAAGWLRGAGRRANRSDQ